MAGPEPAKMLVAFGIGGGSCILGTKGEMMRANADVSENNLGWLGFKDDMIPSMVGMKVFEGTIEENDDGTSTCVGKWRPMNLSDLDEFGIKYIR